MSKAIFLPDEVATRHHAEQLATQLKQGDCVALSGELGSGKSVFARALMRALGVRDHALPSPSFSLIEEYHADSLRVAHMDWYRLADDSEVIMLGVSDYFQPPWISVIEWPERGRHLIPPDAYHLELKLDDQHEHGRWLLRNGNAQSIQSHQ